ncbi:competence protein ComF [Anaplasma marginale str. Dawn]|uniref:ComF family protein n=1 Tax=Anaplasma TaxID=768 RepID=UPI0001B4672F|nr:MULTISPECIES: ComF family protein [Anaplasma]AGZ79285.1 competence protein ComF [Anaplasma marginale str. Gypsy Plains]AGZ80076.1 competence protein ComF [Anaplasma marginale str. Dawn]
MLLLRAVVSKICDALFPDICANCRTIIPRGKVVCDACTRAIRFLWEDFCVVCGAVAQRHTNTCAGCAARPTHISAINSVFVYDECSKNMVLRLKFGDDLFHVRAYARWMCERGKAVLEGADILVPVPMHRVRLMHRKYNQAALLAQAVGKLRKIPTEVLLLKKSKDTPPQHGLAATARRKNVCASFTVADTDKVRGKVIVLIDDVITTGATIAACASALADTGAREIRAVTLCRTLL